MAYVRKGGQGGARPGAGRKPNPNKPRQVAETKLKPVPTLAAEPKTEIGPAIDPKAWMMMLPEIERISKEYATHKSREYSPEMNPFRLPQFPKSVMDGLAIAKLPTMAMDNALTNAMGFGSSQWLAGDFIGGLSGEGLLFLGYTYLSELAQRPEYRIISETIADDATRAWIDFDVVGDENAQKEAKKKDPVGHEEKMADPDEAKKRVAAAGKTDRVKELRDDQLRLEVKLRYYDMARNGGFFGRSHLFHDIRTVDSEDIDTAELKSDIGDSRNEASKTKCPIGAFKGLRSIEPVWTYPLMYNAINPLRKDWYNPQVWYVMGQEIHGSRLATFIPHPVPDMLKPAYAFGGLSLSQMSKPYVDRWLTTVTSVNQLIHSFSVMVLMTDLSTLMQPNNMGPLIARVAMFNMFRDNQGAFVLNKSTEDFKNVSASLAGLHELQAQAQEHLSFPARIPLVKLTGIQPAGLNASSEGEIESYDDSIGAYQARVLDSNLRRTINFEMLSLWGDVDPEITHRWEKLRPETQEEKGKRQEQDQKRDEGYVNMGSISPAEVRKRIIEDKELPYTGLNPDDVPEPPGLGLPGEEEPEPDAGGGGSKEPPDRPAATGAAVPSPKGGGANDGSGRRTYR